MKILAITLGILVVLFLLGWLGLQIRPKSFSPYPQETAPLKTIPLPSGLPTPVERFYKTVYGEQIPVIATAVLKGRATISPFGVKLPARFVFVHNAGRDYRHYFEATWFGIPFLKVNEGYLDGESFFESPMGAYYNEPNTNQGANLAVWAEAGFFPSIWLTDERVRWEPVDDHTALLYVPFEAQEENFVVRFDPKTDLIGTMEAMRFREAGEGKQKILWITRTEPGPYIEGTKLSTRGSATWLDQGKPWAIFTLEEVDYNVDVSEYIRQRGP
jgi:hypothetical protein